MNFEVFRRVEHGHGRQRGIELTITAGREISLSAAAYEALGSPDSVELLFDREQKTIGLRPSSEPHAYRFRRQSPTLKTVVVSAKAFLDAYGLRTAEARRWLARMENDILVCDLRQEPTLVVGPRSRRRQGG